MKQIHFFALKEDMLSVLDATERSGLLKYIRMGQSTKADFECYERGADIQNLGIASTDSASSGISFLVASRETPINPRRVNTVNGGVVYLIDQLGNPDTVTFDPGGLWDDNIIISGRIATVSTSASAQALMKLFNSAISNSFEKIKAFRVGPHAQLLLDSGARLTASAQSPREYDLTRLELQE